MARKDKL